MKRDKASSTALVIARATLFTALDREVGFMIPKRSAELSLQFVEIASPFQYKLLPGLFEFSLVRMVISLIQKMTIPGLFLHYALRKKFIEHYMIQLLEQREVEQIVVLGSGYDTLIFRIHERFPNIRFFEVDHPATQRVKKTVFERNKAGENVDFIAVDLNNDAIGKSLEQHPRYNPSLRTFYLIEGLLMYIPLPETKDIFRQIMRVSAPSSQLLFTFMGQNKGRVMFSNQRRLADLWLRLKGEPFHWGMNEKELKEFIGKLKLQLVNLISEKHLVAKYLKPVNLEKQLSAVGENICIAKIGIMSPD